MIAAAADVSLFAAAADASLLAAAADASLSAAGNMDTNTLWYPPP